MAEHLTPERTDLYDFQQFLLGALNLHEMNSHIGWKGAPSHSLLESHLFIKLGKSFHLKKVLFGSLDSSETLLTVNTILKNIYLYILPQSFFYIKFFD